MEILEILCIKKIKIKIIQILASMITIVTSVTHDLAQKIQPQTCKVDSKYFFLFYRPTTNISYLLSLSCSSRKVRVFRHFSDAVHCCWALWWWGWSCPLVRALWVCHQWLTHWHGSEYPSRGLFIWININFLQLHTTHRWIKWILNIIYTLGWCKKRGSWTC